MDTISGDVITHLPTDKTVPTHNEIQLLDTLFTEQNSSALHRIATCSRDVFIVGALFLAFSTPQVDSIIQRFIKVTTTSPYIMIGVKTVLFMFFYFILINWNLSRS